MTRRSIQISEDAYQALEVARAAPSYESDFVYVSSLILGSPISVSKQDVDELLELKKEKLRQEIRYLKVRNLKIEKALPVAVKAALAVSESYNPPEEQSPPNWCKKCRVNMDSDSDRSVHLAYGCGPYMTWEPELAR